MLGPGPYEQRQSWHRSIVAGTRASLQHVCYKCLHILAQLLPGAAYCVRFPVCNCSDHSVLSDWSPLIYLGHQFIETHSCKLPLQLHFTGYLCHIYALQLTRQQTVIMKRFVLPLLLLACIAKLHCASARLSQETTGLVENADEGVPAADPTTVPLAAAAAASVTAQGHTKPGPGAGPSPKSTPTARLGLPPAPPKHLRRDLVNDMTTPGSHAVMFMQTASTAKVTAKSIVLEDVPIDTVWMMNRPDR